MFRSNLATVILTATLWAAISVASLHADSADSERPSRKGLQEHQLRVLDQMEELRYAHESGEREVTKAGGSQMTDAAMHEIRDITTLKSLYAACRSDISDYGMQCLENLTNLESISLRGERITNEGVESLSKLSKLKTVWLIEADIDHRCLSTIVELKNLEKIYFFNTHVNDEAILILRQELPNCTVVIRSSK